jgi:hypothetical protein
MSLAFDVAQRLGPPPVDDRLRDRIMRGERGGGCAHLGPCSLPADLVEWARAEPTGGFIRCEHGDRYVFVAPESCIERVEPDAAHSVWRHDPRPPDVSRFAPR